MSIAPINSIHAKMLEDQETAEAAHEQRLQTLGVVSALFGGSAGDDFTPQDEQEIERAFKQAAARRAQRKIAATAASGTRPTQGELSRRWSQQSARY